MMNALFSLSNVHHASCLTHDVVHLAAHSGLRMNFILRPLLRCDSATEMRARAVLIGQALHLSVRLLWWAVFVESSCDASDMFQPHKPLIPPLVGAYFLRLFW